MHQTAAMTCTFPITPSIVRVLFQYVVALVYLPLRDGQQIVPVVLEVGALLHIILLCIGTHHLSEPFLAHQVVSSPPFHGKLHATLVPDNLTQGVLPCLCDRRKGGCCHHRHVCLLVLPRVYGVGVARGPSPR